MRSAEGLEPSRLSFFDGGDEFLDLRLFCVELEGGLEHLEGLILLAGLIVAKTESVQQTGITVVDLIPGEEILHGLLVFFHPHQGLPLYEKIGEFQVRIILYLLDKLQAPAKLSDLE